MVDAPTTTNRFCEQLACNVPQISSAAIVTTRIELEMMLLRAFQEGMRQAEATIREKLRSKVMLPGWENVQ